MALSKIKTEGGQGGGRGHSNMGHWESTEDIKIAANKRRRSDARKTISRQLEEARRN